MRTCMPAGLRRLTQSAVSAGTCMCRCLASQRPLPSPVALAEATAYKLPCRSVHPTRCSRQQLLGDGGEGEGSDAASMSLGVSKTPVLGCWAVAVDWFTCTWAGAKGSDAASMRLGASAC